MTLKESLEWHKTAKEIYGSTRWNVFNLTVKYVQFKLFAPKGTQFLLPGPTSTSHPYGFMSPMSYNSTVNVI